MENQHEKNFQLDIKVSLQQRNNKGSSVINQPYFSKANLTAL